MTAAATICILTVGDRLTGSTLSDADVINQAGSSRLSYPLNYWNAMSSLSGVLHRAGLAGRDILAEQNCRAVPGP